MLERSCRAGALTMVRRAITKQSSGRGCHCQARTQCRGDAVVRACYAGLQEKVHAVARSFWFASKNMRCLEKLQLGFHVNPGIKCRDWPFSCKYLLFCLFMEHSPQKRVAHSSRFAWNPRKNHGLHIKRSVIWGISFLQFRVNLLSHHRQEDTAEKHRSLGLRKTDIVRGIVERIFSPEEFMDPAGTYEDYVSRMKDT